jgi:GNAT superfamily N-acetyltransferase
MIEICAATKIHGDAIAGIFSQVVARGDTYVFLPDSEPREGADYFFASDSKCFVATENNAVLGVYKLRPNNIGLGSHVANASFMVHPGAQGKGVGRTMGEHCLEEARRDGFKAMQFNFVVSTNTRAVELWKSLGFVIVGTLPRAFRHVELGLVDAYVMHRFL